MSSHQTRFIPFGQWSPDSVEFEGMELEIASNFTPSYGAYRPIEKLVTHSSVVDADIPNGGISHIVSEDAPPIRLRPLSEGPSVSGSWWSEEFVPGDADNDYHAEKLNQFYPDDNTYIRSDGTEGVSGPVLSYRLQAPASDPVPVVLGDVELKFRVRIPQLGYDRTNYTLSYELWKNAGPDVQIGTTQTIVPITEEWQEVVWQVPITEFAKLTGAWDILEVRFHTFDSGAAVPSFAPYWQADQDELTEGWTGYDDADATVTEDLWENIRRGSLQPGPALNYLETWIQSPEIPSGETSIVGFKLNDFSPPKDPTEGATWLLPGWFTALAASTGDTEATVRVIQPVAVGGEPADGEVFFNYGDQEYRGVFERTISGLEVYDNVDPESTYTTDTFEVLVPANLNLLNFDSPFYLSITGAYGGGGDSQFTTALPKAQWKSNTSGVSGAYTDINSGPSSPTDGTYVSFTGNGRKSTFVKIGNGTQATSKTGHKIYVRSKWVSGDPAINCKVVLYKDISTSPVELASGSFDPGTSFAWKTVNLGSIPKDIDYNDLGLEIFANTPGSNVLHVSEAYYYYPGSSSNVRVYATGTLETSYAVPQISWIALDNLNPKETHARDRTEIYIGNKDKLWNVTDPVWLDVSRTVGPPDDTGPDGELAYGDETTLNVEHKIWDFCTFGDKVIATNFADEIQIKDVTDNEFGPLFGNAATPGSTIYAPRARFCAVVGSQLVLADINPDNYGTHGSHLNYSGSGKPFHLWVSAPMEPDYFDVANLAKQSALFSLVGQPGAITGLVGGEWGTVFKRNSIWKLYYSGLPQIMQLDSIAIGQGCSHPQSIVQVGQDIFFWGNGGIFAVASGSQLIRLSGQKIEKAIFDTLYEDIALAQDYGVDTIENESRVYGAYDAYSGVVWWLYRGKGDEKQKMTRFLCYSTQEDRFTHGKITDLDWSLILGRMNITTSDQFLNRGIMGFTTDTSIRYQRFSDTTRTYPGQLKTKILSSATWGFNIGQEIEIQQVRPIYKSDPDTYVPSYKITVEAAQDPTMQRSVDTKTVSSLTADKDGWIPLGTPMSGEFWRFTVDIPELYEAQLKEFLGVQVRLVRRGDY